MSLRLILTRHAKSSWDHNGPDHDRPLNERGRNDAPRIGKWLRDHDYVPDQIQCSSAARAVETCARIGFDTVPDTIARLYLASPDTMLKQLQQAQGQTVLMIAHNPGIADFAAQLATTPPTHDGFFRYPTCATTLFDFDITTWADLRFGNGTVLDFMVPRDLTNPTPQ